MYKFYFEISKINEKISKIFISSVISSVMSYFDVALNKHNEGQGSVFCV